MGENRPSFPLSRGDPASVIFTHPTAPDGKSLDVDRVGRWSVNASGQVTFVPTFDFTGAVATANCEIFNDGIRIAQVLLRGVALPVPDRRSRKPTPVMTHMALYDNVPLYRRIFEAIIERDNCLPPGAGACRAVCICRSHTRRVESARECRPNAKLAAHGRDRHRRAGRPECATGLHISERDPQLCRAGTLLCGARSLDGNSTDWRYINVRRTVNMIEQSLWIGLQRFVYPRDMV